MPPSRRVSSPNLTLKVVITKPNLAPRVVPHHHIARPQPPPTSSLSPITQPRQQLRSSFLPNIPSSRTLHSKRTAAATTTAVATTDSLLTYIPRQNEKRFQHGQAQGEALRASGCRQAGLGLGVAEAKAGTRKWWPRGRGVTLLSDPPL